MEGPVFVVLCKIRHVGQQTQLRGNEGARQGSDFGRWRDRGVTIGRKVEGEAWWEAGGLDGQLHNSAEAELSLKNGAWPISKGQSPER